jgi:Fic family protein
MGGLMGDEHVGTLRTADVELVGIEHEPPPWKEVAVLVNELCAYVNHPFSNPHDVISVVDEAIHRAAYTLWRVNWVHPFGDGNGRTARAASYAVLCGNLGGEVPLSPRVAAALEALPRTAAWVFHESGEPLS